MSEEPKSVEIVKEEIDPPLAQAMLDNAVDKKRPINMDRVEAYVEEMIAGQWDDNGETIKLTEEGKLGDGFHRLTALVRSGTTQTFAVAYNVPLEAILKTVDAGRPRSTRDSLSMLGMESYIEVAAATRVILQYEDRIAGRSDRGVRAGHTRQQIINWIEQHPEIADYTSQAGRIYSQIKVQKSVVLAALWVTRGHPQWVDFWGGVESGVGFVPGDPRRHVQRIGSSLERRRRSNRLHVLGLIVKAFNKFVDGKTIELLFLKKDEAFPVARKESTRVPVVPPGDSDDEDG